MTDWLLKQIFIGRIQIYFGVEIFTFWFLEINIDLVLHGFFLLGFGLTLVTDVTQKAVTDKLLSQGIHCLC